MKKELKNRASKFTLTKGTSRKRYTVHASFIGLLAFFGVLLYYYIVIYPGKIDTLTFFYYVKSVVVTLGFAATALFYIRWNDSWFRQHADEEFRLKRFELDIERASWFVETALEWKDERGSEIPPEIVDRLTNGLFLYKKNKNIPKHPSEEIMDALIAASSGMKLKAGDFGEISIDKKGIKKAIKIIKKD